MKLTTSQLHVYFHDSGRRVELVRRYVVILGKTEFKIPKGFVTDFASVPRPFWRIIPPWGRYFPAAVVHDYLYSIQDRPREAADKVFLLILKALNIPRWRRWAMYLAVRWCGEAAWKEAKTPLG